MRPPGFAAPVEAVCPGPSLLGQKELGEEVVRGKGLASPFRFGNNLVLVDVFCDPPLVWPTDAPRPCGLAQFAGSLEPCLAQVN